MDDIVSALRAMLGEQRVLTGDAVPVRNQQDASNLPPCQPRALVRPKSTEDVAQILRLCHVHRQRVVIQGGMTGLAGGAHPSADEVALSMELMTGVEEVDATASTLTALAGTPLAVVQQAAEAAGLMCGIDLGARGSCTIGGNVATNAGGNQVLRYGMTRHNVLGLEAVLADGTIVRSLNKMMKNNTGYDWPQLLIGSEGTLAVITRVVLRLHPRPAEVHTAMLALNTFSDGLHVLHAIQSALPGQLLAFEVMWREFQMAAQHFCGASSPLPGSPRLLVLLDVAAAANAGSEPLELALADALEHGWIADAVLAQSQAQARQFWAFRETPAEYRSRGYRVHGLDISLPLAAMEEAVDHLRAEMARRLPGVMVFWFGHAADSNIHVCALFADPDDPKRAEVDAIVYQSVARFGGSISAEHGIGRKKRAQLSISRGPEELALMRRLKEALDPEYRLNANRVI